MSPQSAHWPAPAAKLRQSSRPASYTSPGSAAEFGTTWPDPKSNGVPAMGEPLLRVCAAVVIRADLMAAGDHLSCRSVSSAPMPAMCGLDIDVPL